MAITIFPADMTTTVLTEEQFRVIRNSGVDGIMGVIPANRIGFFSRGNASSEGNELIAYGDSTGMQVKVRSGGAIINGNAYFNDDSETLLVSASSASLPRIDAVVLEVLEVSHDFGLKVVGGTPASPPALPSLINDNTITQMPVAYIYVGAGAVTINPTNVIDARVYASPRVTKSYVLGSWDSPLDATGVFDLNKLFVNTGMFIDEITLTGDTSGDLEVDILATTNNVITGTDVSLCTSFFPYLSAQASHVFSRDYLAYLLGQESLCANTPMITNWNYMSIQINSVTDISTALINIKGWEFGRWVGRTV